MNLTFGEILRLKRTRAGLSVKDVGEKSGFHFATIATWERKKRSWKELPYEWLERLAAALQCPVEEIKEDKAA